MATPSKTQHLTEIHSLLRKRYRTKDDKVPDRLTVLEAVVFAVAHEGAPRGPAEAALARFKEGFFDWNEVRVSTIEEIQAALTPLPDAEQRAQTIRRFLRQLFEKTYGFTLEALAKKPLKESLKVLAEYEALGSDFVQATVVQRALGGHALPIDANCRRALERLGIADAATETASLRSLLERAIPKNRGLEFVDLLEQLTQDTCLPGEPDCPRCELRKTCPTGLARKEEARLAEKQAAGRLKAQAKEDAKAAKAKAPVAPPAPPAAVASAKGAPKEPKGAKGRARGR